MAFVNGINMQNNEMPNTRTHSQHIFACLLTLKDLLKGFSWIHGLTKVIMIVDGADILKVLYILKEGENIDPTHSLSYINGNLFTNVIA